MRQGFFRTIFGDPFGKHEIKTGKNIIFDIDLLKKNPIERGNQTPVFVFGSENMSRLIDLGFSCILVDKRNEIIDKLWYSHRFLAYEMAMDLFDEAICLDFDCHQTEQLPGDFWAKMRSRDCVQVSLMKYRRPRAFWRSVRADRGYTPCGCFTYLRGKDSINGLIAHMKKMIGKGYDIYNDETVWASYTDDLNGGWKGVDSYIEKHEPLYFHCCKIKLPSYFPANLFQHDCFSSGVVEVVTVKEKMKTMMESRANEIKSCTE